MQTTDKTSKKADLIEIIEKECLNRNAIIDVASGEGEMLFLAEKIGFSKLVGFDVDGRTEIGILQLKATEANMKYVDYCSMVNCKLPNYQVEPNDYRLFPYENYKFDCVVLNNFLHFIPDEEKFSLIERLYKVMQLEGIMIIKVNHNKHILDTAPTHAKNLGGNTWEGINVWKEKRYLIDVEEFTANLESKYPMLHEYYRLNPDRDVLYVIKKTSL